MYLHLYLNIFCNFWRLVAVAPRERLLKHFRLDVSIINIEPKFFFASALNSVYLVYVKGVFTKTRNALKLPETSQKLIKTTCNHLKSN